MTTRGDVSARELVLVRVFDAPRTLVFKAWTEPKRLAQWWGPKGFTCPVCEMDARPGGKWRIVMRGPDGGEYPHGGEILEIDPPAKIVMTNALEGDAAPFGPSTWTVNFDEVDGKTTLTTRVVCETVEDRDTMDRMQWRVGYGMSLDKLAVELAIDRREPAKTLDVTAPPNLGIVVVTRWFDAPRELVWKVTTEAEHFQNWWGPRRYKNHILEMDVRVGGRYRIEQRGGNGEVHPFRGEYLEIEAPHRLVMTQGYADFPPLTLTIELTEKDGGTLLTGTMDMGSVEVRDTVLKSGMESGMRESYERMDELMATLAK
ncbi:MAG TPA: SRPBCC family protein [Caulobacteraceae bacterium]|jgi:uncharacterized protein YndB with AHSA1/START domain|nr:SRPBCC family protein [Caulobacteraceae bacterium]